MLFIRGRVWSTMRKFRKSKAFSFVLGFAVAGAAGALAFVIYTGLSGSAGGKFTTAQNGGSAVTVALKSGGTVGDLDVGGTTIVPLTITNTDTSNAHTLTSDATVTFTSTPSVCASHLSVAGVYNVSDGQPSNALKSGTAYSPNQSQDVNMNVTADASTPNTCANGTWQANFSDTTTP